MYQKLKFRASKTAKMALLSFIIPGVDFTYFSIESELHKFPHCASKAKAIQVVTFAF